MDRQEKNKAKEGSENGSENGSNDDSDSEDKVCTMYPNCVLYREKKTNQILVVQLLKYVCVFQMFFYKLSVFEPWWKTV